MAEELDVRKGLGGIRDFELAGSGLPQRVDRRVYDGKIDDQQRRAVSLRQRTRGDPAKLQVEVAVARLPGR